MGIVALIYFEESHTKLSRTNPFWAIEKAKRRGEHRKPFTEFFAVVGAHSFIVTIRSYNLTQLINLMVFQDLITTNVLLLAITIIVFVIPHSTRLHDIYLIQHAGLGSSFARNGPADETSFA